MAPILRFALAGLLPLAAACTSSSAATRAAGPYVLVLGTAQDGGLPQIGCDGDACRAARAHPERRRAVTSLLLADPRTGRRYLFDATPDLPDQVERADGHPRSRRLAGARPPLFEGIFLTHAHMGHYTGLLHLGREAYGGATVPLYVSARMADYLRSNGPWSLLLDDGVVELVEVAPDVPIGLGPELSVTPVPVPHREEFSDTLAFRIDGPDASVLYLPDIDKWERWDVPIEEEIAAVDWALLDGSFFDDGEVPGRDLSEIPHPFIVESLARFAPLPRGERAKVLFTHLNHTNPAADPSSPAAARVRAAGMGVARDGQVLPLSSRLLGP